MPIAAGSSIADLRRAYAGRRVLITGGLGFIGASLAHRLVALGAEVSLLDSLVPEHGGNRFNIDGLEGRVSVTIGDVCDEATMAAAVDGQECVFNLVGQRSHLDSMRDPFTDLYFNCRAPLSVLDACRRHSPRAMVVFASTRQLYGAPQYLPVDEQHPVAPVDVNGIHKAAGEWYHRIYAKVYRVPMCILRLTNIYGPRMRVKDERQTFLGWWLRQLLDGQEIEVFGDGRQFRDFLYIDDAVELLLMVGCTPAAQNQLFNVAGNGPVSLKELAALLVSLVGGGGWRSAPFPEDLKAIDIGSYYGVDDKIRTTLGWRPNVALHDGLARTIAYFREHRRHYWP